MQTVRNVNNNPSPLLSGSRLALASAGLAQRRAACRRPLLTRLADDRTVWAIVDEVADDRPDWLRVGAMTEQAAVYALILDVREPVLPDDDVMPVPGCNPQAGGHGRYWLTGTVGREVRYTKKNWRRREAAGYRFLLTVGELRVVGKLVASRRQVKIRPGSRLTVTCVLAVPAQQKWEADDLPAEWRSPWQVLDEATGGHLGCMVDLEPPGAPESRAAGVRRPTRLLLDTDYGGGPLWYRSVDNKTPWCLGLDHFRLSQPLRERLVTWTAGDYHLHYDYEDDNPQHEAAWHAEGLALLAALRAELGPDYDIKFAHDLEA